MSRQEEQVFSGRYELVRHIARGGMAEVYLARDLLLDRPVALKVLFPELSTDRSFVERFRREAQNAAGLNHPNVVSVFDWGEQDGTYFMVMEFIEGRTLSSLLRAEGPLLADRAADIAADVAAALSFAHRNGVVHRDVKPGNVLISPDGHVKVTDFGIARALNTEESLTQTGAVMGTATYFSPEQAQGNSVDGRSDVYSLGVMLYEMVVGRPPFTADNPMAVAYKHVREEPRPPRERNPDVPAAFEAIILQAMAKNPNDRYASADELRADLLRYRQGRRVLASPTAVAATQAVEEVAATTAQPAVDRTRAVTVTETSTVAPVREERRTSTYVVLLVVMLAILGALLFVLWRSLNGGDDEPQVATIPSVLGAEEADARKTLTDAGFQVTKVEEPSDEIDVGRVISTDPQAGTEAVQGTTVKIVVSSGGTPVAVPDVVGDTWDQAEDILRNVGLNPVRVNEASDRVQRERVIRTDPLANAEAKKGSEIKVFVSAGKGDTTVPSVAGKTAEEAGDAMVDAGLKFRNRTEPSSEADKGKVTRTDPAEGSLVEKGSTITIYVGSGPATSRVPNVVGDSRADAEAALKQAGFKVSVKEETTTDPAEDGRVIRQNPEANSEVPPGTTVTITVGKKAASTSSSTPTTSSTTSTSTTL